MQAPNSGPSRHERLSAHLSEKVLRLHATLAANGIPHAFGGAIALGYHKEPRATSAIDVNVFVGDEAQAAVIELCDTLFGVADRDELLQQLAASAQARVMWDETPVDVFFSDTDFHDSMAGRARNVDFLGVALPILTAEDLIVCKALFDRRKDWLDIFDVFRTRADDLDVAYIKQWLGYFVDADDHRFARLDTTIDEATDDAIRARQS